MKDKEKEELKAESAEGTESLESIESIEGSESTEGSESSEGSDVQKPTAEEQLEEMKDKYLRQVAEFENYRKRVLKEKADLILNGGERVLTEILPVIDDIERAKAGIDTATDLEAVKEGIQLIMEKFMSFLKKEGVEPIEAVGQDFDTEYHEAIAMVPGQSKELKGKVLDCVQTGYKLNNKVIRYAKVAVAE